jgi:enamine deaminase RidA (YjgF/YER057c/UK114 family)
LQKALVLSGASILLSALLAPVGDSAEISRYALPSGNTLPIARAVDVPAGYGLTFHSGLVADPADKSASLGSPAYWGDTKTQTFSALSKLQASLKELGLSFKDVVKMNVFLVADPLTGQMDFKGFMASYIGFFGTPEQPNLPARSAVQVAGLAVPGALVEIEVVVAHGTAIVAPHQKKP